MLINVGCCLCVYAFHSWKRFYLFVRAFTAQSVAPGACFPVVYVFKQRSPAIVCCFFIFCFVFVFFSVIVFHLCSFCAWLAALLALYSLAVCTFMCLTWHPRATEAKQQQQQQRQLNTPMFRVGSSGGYYIINNLLGLTTALAINGIKLMIW